MAKQEQMKISTKILIALVILFGLAVVASVVAASIMLFSGSSYGSGNVAVIPVEGVILAGGSSARAGIAGSDTLIDDIKTAEEDDSIDAVIFMINSPGGSAVASDEVAAAISRMEKPSVAVVREVGASGAYWIASSTEHVVANRMSVTGSIGVIGSYLSFGRFLEHWNVTYNQLVSGEMKDVGTPFRELEPRERAFLQEKLDLIHDFFIDAVAANRNMSVDEVTELADGRFFLGSEAFGNGLVDELGGEEEAIAWLNETYGIEAQLVEYTHKESLLDLLAGIQQQPGGLPSALSDAASGEVAVPMAR